jgi:cardiolipin synthase
MVFFVVAIAAIFILAFLLFLALFEPYLPYRIRTAPNLRIDSQEFMRNVQIVTDARLHRHTKIDVLTNGEVFYEAELEAIRSATQTINLEAYIFGRGDVTRRFVKALAERARAGVQVNLILDAVGSFLTYDNYFREMTEAGGKLAWYHPLRWHTWPRFNNRTHRELLIIDGRIGFLGGAGFHDQWLHGTKRQARWRDSMFRVEGEAVTGLQATFLDNWIEAAGEILIGDRYFPVIEDAGEIPSLVIDSSPSAGGSTRARILYQTLLASACESVYITTPYFLPDPSAREEMVRAIRERGVEIQIITPGQKSDHLLTRRSSRRLYGQLLQAGARIFEYEPTMIHAKTMVIDGMWAVVGSSNFDHRSFGLNDEVNLAAFDRGLSRRVMEDFERDRAASHEVLYRDWLRRPITERAHEYFGWLLERQQ